MESHEGGLSQQWSINGTGMLHEILLRQSDLPGKSASQATKVGVRSCFTVRRKTSKALDKAGLTCHAMLLHV